MKIRALTQHGEMAKRSQTRGKRVVRPVRTVRDRLRRSGGRWFESRLTLSPIESSDIMRGQFGSVQRPGETFAMLKHSPGPFGTVTHRPAAPRQRYRRPRGHFADGTVCHECEFTEGWRRADPNFWTSRDFPFSQCIGRVPENLSCAAMRDPNENLLHSKASESNLFESLSRTTFLCDFIDGILSSRLSGPIYPCDWHREKIRESNRVETCVRWFHSIESDAMAPVLVTAWSRCRRRWWWW